MAAPVVPQPNTKMKTTSIPMCRIRATKAIVACTFTLLWAWRNFWVGKLMASENNWGMVSIVNCPARSAISSSCPRAFKIGLAKMYIGKRMIQVTNRIIHDLCKYTPSNWTCPAPKAWPHKVSSALPIPSYKFVSWLKICLFHQKMKSRKMTVLIQNNAKFPFPTFLL